MRTKGGEHKIGFRRQLPSPVWDLAGDLGVAKKMPAHVLLFDSLVCVVHKQSCAAALNVSYCSTLQSTEFRELIFYGDCCKEERGVTG